MRARLSRWWRCQLLSWQGWPDPEGTLDWLESRKRILRERENQ